MLTLSLTVGRIRSHLVLDVVIIIRLLSKRMTLKLESSVFPDILMFIFCLNDSIP